MKIISKLGLGLILLLTATSQSFAVFSASHSVMSTKDYLNACEMEEGANSRFVLQKKQHMYYLVDGKPMTSKEVDKLDQEKIEKIEFIKEKEKIREYTKEDVDAVVLITIKKPKAEADTLQ